MAHGDEATADRTDPDPTPEATPGVCPVAWCPFCTAVGAVRPVAPDVVEHLLKAGTEMFLAFRAVIEQRGDHVAGHREPPPVRLEKIDIG